MIPQKNLSLLSNRLARKGGRRLPEGILERDYCLAWFLVGLSRSPLRNALAFKGGTALKKCYFYDYRFSEDLDFTLTVDIPWEEIRQGLDLVFLEVRQSSGIEIRFDRQDRDAHENSYTFYLAYEGPLPRQYARSVKVDITLREKVVEPPKARPILKGYDEYDDLPGNARIPVYSLNEIGAEKVVALHDPARNEPRDLYDLWFLVANHHVDLPDIVEAIGAKIEFRGRSFREMSPLFTAKEMRLRKLWNTRLEAQMIALPEFETVYRTARAALRQAGIGKT